MRRFAVIATLLVTLSACSEPPRKELDQAQGAIDAAHAAGADQYAPDDYGAATTALQKAQDAVTQRDYRSALGYAIDARERAKDAARSAVDGQARARSTAESLIADLLARVQQLDTRITAAETAKVPARELRGPRDSLRAINTSLQEAGAQVAAKKYREAATGLQGVREKIEAAIKAVDAIEQRPAPRRRR